MPGFAGSSYGPILVAEAEAIRERARRDPSPNERRGWIDTALPATLGTHERGRPALGVSPTDAYCLNAYTRPSRPVKNTRSSPMADEPGNP
jgi:hypothetical protein